MAEPLLREVHGALLRRARLRQGRKLEDVAAAAGISMQYLSEIERGRKEPSSEVLAAVCRGLGTSVAMLTRAALGRYLSLRAVPGQGQPGSPEPAEVIELASVTEVSSEDARAETGDRHTDDAAWLLAA